MLGTFAKCQVNNDSIVSGKRQWNQSGYIASTYVDHCNHYYIVLVMYSNNKDIASSIGFDSQWSQQEKDEGSGSH